MREFGHIIGLEGLVPDDDNECILEIDNFIVTLSGQGDDFLLIYSIVGSLPEKNRESLYARLLSGNYFFAETGGATLAVNPYGGDIQFLYGVNVKGMDAGVLSRIMENYLERLEHWSGVCKDGAKDRAAEDQPSWATKLFRTCRRANRCPGLATLSFNNGIYDSRITCLVRPDGSSEMADLHMGRKA